MVICDNCKHEFSLESVHIYEVGITIDDQQLTLLFFTCPKCNKIYRVGLKDKHCEELTADLERTKTRIQRNYGSNNVKMASELGYMVQKKAKRLKDYMDKLNQKFAGTFVFAASQNKYGVEIIYLP